MLWFVTWMFSRKKAFLSWCVRTKLTMCIDSWQYKFDQLSIVNVNLPLAMGIGSYVKLRQCVRVISFSGLEFGVERQPDQAAASFVLTSVTGSRTDPRDLCSFPSEKKREIFNFFCFDQNKITKVHKIIFKYLLQMSSIQNFCQSQSI